MAQWLLSFMKNSFSRKQILIFLLIFVLGVFLRFYKLGSVPDSLNWDEVSWGYNSYSILKTGHDEYGKFLPLSFKAFGDYKQPVYVYAGAISVKFFGLNSFAVRFPSAFFGSLTIISVFLLTYELFQGHVERKKIAFLAMALFAISPWAVQFSRVAFEANLGAFFTITGAWICILAFRKKRLPLSIIGVLIISLSCYTYHSQKIFTPVLFIGLLVYSKAYLLSNRKFIFITVLFFIFCNMFWLVDTRTTQRGRSVMFTSQQTAILEESIEKARYDQKNQDLIGELLHNRRFVYLNKYIENYLLHFSPNFLFMKGDNARHHAPDNGVLYLISLPFIIIGMVNLLKDNHRSAKLLFLWLFLAPIASALAVDAPNASRSMVFLPTWQIFTSYGIFSIVSKTKEDLKLRLILTIMALYLINFIFYAHMYFIHTNTEYFSYWQYGYKEAVFETTHEKKPIIYLSDVEQAYIFYLFYTQKNPLDYIREGGSARIAKECFSIDNAYFGKCEEKVKSGSIVISAKYSPAGFQYGRKDIFYPNKETALTIYRF